MKKVNNIVMIAAVIVSALVSAVASAAVPYNNVRIVDFSVGDPYGEDAVIRLSKHDNMDKPACATNGTWTLRIDGSTQAGKLAISTAMLAQATGANVDFYGENFCMGTINKLRWIKLDN